MLIHPMWTPIWGPYTYPKSSLLLSIFSKTSSSVDFLYQLTFRLGDLDASSAVYLAGVS